MRAVAPHFGYNEPKMELRLILIPVQAFLLGSIPFGFLLYRLKTGSDIRHEGSGNIGATNVMRTAGRSLGILTLVLDAAKGLAAMALADYLSYRSIDQPYVYMRTGSDVPSHHYALLGMALVLAVAGHIFTPWLKGKGGKGVATALGAFIVLAPQALLAAVVLFVAVAAATRYVSLASILASFALPFLMAWRYGSAYPPVIYVSVAIVAVLVIVRHRANFQRLLAGTENRLGQKKVV